MRASRAPLFKAVGGYYAGLSELTSVFGCSNRLRPPKSPPCLEINLPRRERERERERERQRQRQRQREIHSNDESFPLFHKMVELDREVGWLGWCSGDCKTEKTLTPLTRTVGYTFFFFFFFFSVSSQFVLLLFSPFVSVLFFVFLSLQSDINTDARRVCFRVFCLCKVI